MKANIMTDEESQSAFLNPTYAFKERKCRGFWLEVMKLGDRYGEIVDLEGLDDIELSLPPILPHEMQRHAAGEALAH
ncbi:hypothetical protein O9929_03335 [Vibrio lentus]|nr:hypothetical protein [Vibrio lentus]